MRRLMAITAFALFVSVPVWAQHGGGHGGGGGHASFGGGHAGFSGGHAGGFAAHSFSGARSFSGPHSFSGAHVGAARPFNSGLASRAARAPFLHDGVGFRNGIGFRNGVGFRNGFRLRTYGFRNGFRNCFGWYGCWGYGYPWWGYYDPWWWDSNSNYDDDYDQNLAIANQMNEQSLEQQQMRQEEAERDQDLYPRRPPRQTSSDEKQGEPVLPATVLVFRDQHKQEVQNYAIVGQTLWNFAPQHTEKIPLADLDLTATTKANQDRGLTFRVPSAGEAQ
jgi:hypothetical protein